MVDKEKAQKKEQPARPAAPVAKKAETTRSVSAPARNEKPKKPNAIARWYRETLGELRKVSWPTPKEAWKLTRIVLIVMLAMSAGLGLLDFIFEKGIVWLLSLG